MAREPRLPARIHFVGIGGIGMSGLAMYALERGSRVTGSDTAADSAGNAALDRLRAAGATVMAGHSAGNLPERCDIVVTTAAIAADNPEAAEARRRGVAVESRAEFLGTVMASHAGTRVAVAGAHGKTTTTALLGWILSAGGQQPTVFAGGEAPDLGGNFLAGDAAGPLVTEACEAYGSFLKLAPDVAVVTNVEPDHLDYYGSAAAVTEAFVQFLQSVPATGTIVLPAGREDLAASARARVVTWDADGGGADSSARLIADGRIEWTWDGRRHDVQMPIPGRHMMANAVTALTAAVVAGAEPVAAARAVSTFSGVQRRLDELGTTPVPGGAAVVIDDYAHHPTEITATIAAVRADRAGARIMAVFQPHLYSRTRDFMQEFADALDGADGVIVTDIYPAREGPIPGVRAAEIVHRLPSTHSLAAYVADRQDLPALLARAAQPGDVLLFLGAGNIREQAEQMAAIPASGAR